jgi:hypothetical protein
MWLLMCFNIGIMSGNDESSEPIVDLTGLDLEDDAIADKAIKFLFRSETQQPQKHQDDKYMNFASKNRHFMCTS